MCLRFVVCLQKKIGKQMKECFGRGGPGQFNIMVGGKEERRGAIHNYGALSLFLLTPKQKGGHNG